MLVVCELVSKIVIIKNEAVLAEYDLIDQKHLHAQSPDLIGTAAEIQVLNSNIYVSQRMKIDNGFLIHFKFDEENNT